MYAGEFEEVADKQADDWATLARQYEDQRDEVQAQLDALTKT